MTQNTGTCHCGEIAIEVNGEPQQSLLCYCNDCKKINGGSRLTGAVYAKDAVNVKKGIPKKYIYEGGKGKIESFFCGGCGTPLYAYPHAHDEVVIVRVNSIDHFTFEPNIILFEKNVETWEGAVDKV